MKILIVGASGSIGGEALTQCIAHPDITEIIAFSRRELTLTHQKLTCVIIDDFSNWSNDLLKAHSDAAAMIWAMGSYKGSPTVDLEYGLAFVDSMGKVLEQSAAPRVPFRYIQLSGMFVKQDQDVKLLWLEYPRKLKGQLDKKVLDYGREHDSFWQTFVIMPGGVITRGMLMRGVTKGLLGDKWAVLIEELGAFMAHLAIGGQGEQPITHNARIASKGREVLKEVAQLTR